MKRMIILGVVFTLLQILVACNRAPVTNDPTTTPGMESTTISPTEASEEELRPVMQYSLQDAMSYLSKERGYGKFRFYTGNEYPYDIWFSYCRNYSKVILYTYPGTDDLFALSVISSDKDLITEDINQILYLAIDRGGQFQAYTQYGIPEGDGKRTSHIHTVIIEDAPFDVAVIEIEMNNSTDILADDERRNHFWELYKTGQLQELYDFVKSYIEEEVPHKWDYAYDFLEILASANGIMDEIEIVVMEDSCFLYDKQVSELTETIHFRPYIELQIKSEYFNPEYVFFDMWAEPNEYWTVSALCLDNRLYAIKDIAENMKSDSLANGEKVILYEKQFLRELNMETYQSTYDIELGDFETASLQFADRTGETATEYVISEDEIEAYRKLYALRKLQRVRFLFEEYVYGLRDL